MNATAIKGAHEILVVDDEPSICELLRRGLKEDNFTVTSFEGVRGAAEAIREHKPCLVILDLALPDGNGLDLLRDIKKLSPEVPVAVLSGTNSAEDASQSLRLGACEFLKKPVDWHYLRNIAHLCSFLKESSKNTGGH